MPRTMAKSEPQAIVMDGKRYALVPIAEYRRLSTIAHDLATKTISAEVLGRVSSGDKVRALRLSAGLSQKALAEAAGVRHETVNRIERGHNTADTETLAKIERALNDAKKGKK